MEILIDYIGWILIALTIIIFILYKWIRNDSNSLTAKYETEKRFKFNKNNKSEIILEALKKSNFKNIHFDEINSTYYAKTRVSIWSWSELIEVKITDNEEETRINFLSICSLFTQIISWGKNRRNARRFFDELNRLR
ncbi:hypothetical protein [Tenuifilum osseticum]|uniref:hypothetical protein n=1 Tax=Tenuifilum osseticum TaxID=3374723 RepID=UPI0034E4E9FA